jgi:hypothetical protein
VSSTSQVTTFSDIYTDLMNRVRVDTSQTATITQAKRYTNIALQDMHLGFDQKFPWAERSGRLITQAQYSTGTLSIDRGSTTLTGSGTAWNTNNDFSVKNMRANGKIKIAGGTTPYTISAVSGDTAATLSSKFTEDDVSGQTYIYYEDEYDLATDFLRIVDMQRFSEECNISLIGRTEFRRRSPSNSVPGRPSTACLIDYAPSGNTTPIRRVRLNPPPSTFTTIPYAYITSNLAVSSAGVAATALSADSDEPIVPLRYRHAIVFHALYHYYRDKKDDSRSQEAKAEYTDIMLRISGDVEVGASRPQIRPRVSPYAARARTPYGGGRGRYDIGGRFDRGE